VVMMFMAVHIFINSAPLRLSDAGDDPAFAEKI
jgi:hypothetical protein